MTAISGSAAAVTGAASGIGRALALELAARGADLALADRDEAGLQTVAAEIAKAHSGTARRKVTTIASTSATRLRSPCFAQAATAAHPVAQHRDQQCRRVAARPVWRDRPGADGLVVQHQFLGRGACSRAPSCRIFLARQREAHIVNLSSIFGIIAPPGQTAYCAAKFAVRGFSESPAARTGGNHPIRPVRLFGGASRRRRHQDRPQLPHRRPRHRQCPARGVDRTVRQAWQRHRPADAARRIIKGTSRNEPRILVGRDAQLMDLLQRFLPATYWRILARRIEKIATKAGNVS